MSYSNIGNLLSAWSDVNTRPDPTNLRGLLQALQNLQKSPGEAGLRKEIIDGAANLSRAFEQAHRESEMDARRLPDYSPLHEMYDYTISAYSLARNVVDYIRQDREALSEDGLIETLEDMEEALAEMEYDTEQWAEWLKGDLPRCTRCGFEEEGHHVCPHCEIELLIPDSRSPESNSREQAVLGPEYVQVYNAYGKLQHGEIGLSEFFQTTGPLQQSIRHWNALVNAGGLAQLEEDLAEAISGCIQRSVSGLQQLTYASESRAWRDINDGWDTVFNAAVDMQRELPRLHRAMGDEESAAAIEASYRIRDTA